MYCNTCEANPCTCVRVSSPAMPRQTYKHQPFGITKEEFGLDLYEAIWLQSAIIQCHKNVDIYRKKCLGYRVQDQETKRAEFQKQFMVIIERDLIEPGDIRRILAQGGMV